jgi:peptidyl-Lys metalloendopeptidase
MPPVDSVNGSTSFTSCSTSRQSDLNTARNNAVTYSSGANSYLQAGTVGSRYTTWFGTYQSSRYSTVRSHFVSILDAMDNASVTFSCTCTDSAYAYVYSNQPYTIYLCNAFWSAPALGTDSKAGTLVHEMSHFNVVAGTSDYAYGQTAAKRLASTNPKRAINNADSHEYFAENTPALP